MPLLVMAAACFSQQSKNQDSVSSSPANCKFADGKSIQTAYSRPQANGRKIFGGVVPDGDVWPVGGGSPATLNSDSDLTIGGEDVPAGSYVLFAIPAGDKWTLIISKKKSGSDSRYSKEDDLLRVGMQVATTPQSVERFTIVYEPKDGKCILRMSWENTQAWLDIREKKLCWPTTSPLTYQCPDE